MRQKENWLFKYGSQDGVVSDTANGTITDLPAYWYEYKYRAGKNTYYRTFVIEVELPRQFPHIIINSKIEDALLINLRSSVLPVQDIKNRYVIKLEGDFNEFFTLFASGDYAVEILRLLAPDAMQTILESSSKCDIEILGNKLYFYWPLPDTENVDTSDKIKTAKIIIDDLHKKLTYGQLTSQLDEYEIAKAKESRIKTTMVTKDTWIVFIFLLLFMFAFPFLQSIGLPKEMVNTFTLSVMIIAPFLIYYEVKTRFHKKKQTDHLLRYGRRK